MKIAFLSTSATAVAVLCSPAGAQLLATGRTAELRWLRADPDTLGAAKDAPLASMSLSETEEGVAYVGGGKSSKGSSKSSKSKSSGKSSESGKSTKSTKSTKSAKSGKSSDSKSGHGTKSTKSSKSGDSKSDKGAKSTKSSKSSKSSTSSDESKDSGCPDLQEGFQCGMAPEINGLWVGDEKFYDAADGTTYDYCSRAMFHPANGENFLTWNGGYLGAGDAGEPESCTDVGVDALGKTINGTWLPLLSPSEAYILEIEQKKCLDPVDCEYDVAADFPGYAAVATACGAHLKRDSFRPDEFSCELYLAAIIENSSGDQELVSVLTYYTYLGGYDNYICPSKPTFDEADLASDPNAQGMARFVLQANDLTDSFDTTEWDCVVE